MLILINYNLLALEVIIVVVISLKKG